VAGVVYADRNGSGTPDTGEGLAGVDVQLSETGADMGRVKTDAEGRFRFADVSVRVYALSISDAPDGWVVEDEYSQIVVNGSGSASNLTRRAVRPLTDVMSAAMRFTRDTYQVGDHADIEVTLTNSGTADVTGVKAGCDRSGGEGPELRDVRLGDLGWNTSGVTVPAGQTRTFTISGSVSEETVQYGAVGYACDFGPGESPRGHPAANALARVPGGPPADVRMAFYHDRDGDQIGRPDEMLAGVAIGLKDAISGAVVAKSRTNAEGRVVFEDVPPGPYQVRVYGPWKFRDDGSHIVFAGSCWTCQAESWSVLVPASDVPEEDVAMALPAPADGPNGGGAGPDIGLAQTGASVLGLIALGVLALAGGFGALVMSRRRTD
jgi:LPXTG-motif cell wall-anchored protein